MNTCYILTITDTANFDRVEHHSVWDTYAHAHVHAILITSRLVLRDSGYGLGNTFDIDICQMPINTASNMGEQR